MRCPAIGGSAADARYERVSSGQTGHAEAVKIDYDPRQVSYGRLMQVFFSVAHDPTKLNRRGRTGGQYRSAIFTDDARQQAASAPTSPSSARPAATAHRSSPAGQRPALLPGRKLPPELHGELPAGAYIRYYDAPKLAALGKFPALYRREAALVPMR